MSRPKLPDAPAAYDKHALQQILNRIADELGNRVPNNADLRLKPPFRITFTDTAGAEWIIAVDTSGAVTTEAYHS